MAELKDRVNDFRKTVADKVGKVTERRPKETKGTLYGIGYGAFAGYLFGGAVTLGGAVVLPLIAVAAVTGGLIGNRAGIGKDKKDLLNEIDHEIAAVLETDDLEESKQLHKTAEAVDASDDPEDVEPALKKDAPHRGKSKTSS